MATESRLGLAGRMAKPFLRSKLTPVIVLASIGLGVAAVVLTPREEEPQIVVPMVDVIVPMPGASPAEVETQLTTPLERRLWGIPGVEYVYSVSGQGSALVTVRFAVNEPLEPSLVKVHQELAAHPEVLPPTAMKPIVRALTIDDVPFLTLTLHADDPLPAGELRKLGEEVAKELADVPRTANVSVIGGARRTIRIEPDPDRLRALAVSIGDVAHAVQTAQAELPAGALVAGGRRVELEASGFFRSASELQQVVVAVRDGRPIYVTDVARVVDGPEPEPAVILTADAKHPGFSQAVSIVVAKRPGTNATELAERVLARVEGLRGRLLPGAVHASVTRNYGETAGEKSSELIEHLLIATLSVIVLILLAMGWRSAVVVGVAVPVTLALTLLLTYLNGYTLNRVTLFALIFSIGILVDDAIVVVENIHRHLYLPGPKRSFAQVILDAVDEVGNPTILATFAVIAAILPMAMVRGLMGPYMRPIPVGASLAMIFSLLIAFAVSPWAAMLAFRKEAKVPELDPTGMHPGDPDRDAPEPERDVPSAHAESAAESRFARLDRRIVRTLLGSWKVQLAFGSGVIVLLAAAVALLGTGVVKVKMLPFDNKSELQVQLDLPKGAAREEALAVGQALARRLLQEAEVSDVQIHSGVAAPFTFVGMVRHSFFREAPEQVDLQVNLVPKHDRKASSHQIAVAIRPELARLAEPSGAQLKVVEIPPGPPVLDTLVAEVYGPTAAERRASPARSARPSADEGHRGHRLDAGRPGPCSSSPSTERRPRSTASSRRQSSRRSPLAGHGGEVGASRSSAAPAGCRSCSSSPPRSGAALDRSSPSPSPAPGRRCRSPSSSAPRRRGRAAHPPQEPHAGRLRLADLAGEIESPLYALLALEKQLAPLRGAGGGVVPRYGLDHPATTEPAGLKWDGEWHITLEVFRDLGLAFAAVLLLIYVLMVGWFQSFTMPLVILVPIPLSLIGILPAHALTGSFFTATSMIGFIAGAGIVVRNSIILVDFAELKLREGMPLALAVEEAVVVRFRPMLLTALAVIVGSAVMLADPIFQGLAVALMSGAIAATLLSRYAVPILYHLLARHGRAAELQRAGARALAAQNEPQRCESCAEPVEARTA